ncbi:hypothetical protein PSH97_21810 [Pseudomonas cucumis]|uniref:Uncharacterized protein n=1 Tax=Pseudomonas cucumis TaxID=2954082 RepID=A0ABY9EU03_9PSED|nr:hypothetical protein [Pseudomonas cucumis]WLG83711.1 hypothetical protein PSH97_21810 [Pseudomonas cucumis]
MVRVTTIGIWLSMNLFAALVVLIGQWVIEVFVMPKTDGLILQPHAPQTKENDDED